MKSIEVKIPKEIREYREAIFFGLTGRQLVCSLLALGAAVGLYFLLRPVAGDADIFLVPSIAAGNLMCKALYGMAGGKMAGGVMGARGPITVKSRSAAPEEKYDSIAIAAAMAQSNP